MPENGSDPPVINLARRGFLRPTVTSLVALTALLLVAMGAAFLTERIRDLADASAQAKRQLSSLDHRVGRVELQIERLLAKQLSDDNEYPGGANHGARANGGRGRVGTAAALTAEEIELVRNYIKVPPPAGSAPPKFAIGAAIDDSRLTPLPLQITEKVPRLAGAKFTSDRNGAIVIVSGGTVGFIIPPN